MNIRSGALIHAASLAIAIWLSGCKSPSESRLPTFPLADARSTLVAFTARSAGITTVQAEAILELSQHDPQPQSVHLDAALLLRSPDDVRLRAWKFGTAVFDLTLRGDRAWAYVPRDEARPAIPAARQSIAKWLRLLQGQVESNGSRLSLHGDDLLIDSPSDGGTLRCTIDRRTLTANSYVQLDRDGRELFRLVLRDYEIISGHAWPMTIVANSARQDSIQIRMSDVSLNEPLPATAFDPPARADVLP